jgi:gliding-associated putative ABC transporter substrate-binding component GldG
VRINLDLIQDLNADKLPSVIGMAGGKPQMELLPWHYFPLLTNVSGHPISKNLDYVVAQFPNSIDTVKAEAIKKTVLLSTSGQSRILSSPAKVTWKSLQSREDLNSFDKRNIPVAMLLEGKFSSIFANRVSVAIKDSLASFGQPFISTCVSINSMIVISDGDMALNAVTQNDGPLPMGVNIYSRYQYANKEFILNCLEYLTDKSNILESRSKEYSLRLLDKQKLEGNKTMWQAINIIIPVLLIIIFGSLYQYIRQRKYNR